MRIAKLALKNFRLHVSQTFSFSPHLNIIEGPNATGKTALLEALYLAALGSSFRTPRHSELIRHGAKAFSLELNYHAMGLDQQLAITGNGQGCTLYYHGNKQGSLSSLIGGLKMAIFTPDDISLIKGAPQLRRQYLDTQLEQTDPLYSHHLKRYRRALKQRNCLLRIANTATLDIWEFELAHAAAYLLRRRKLLVDALTEQAAACYRAISGSERILTLRYQPSSPPLDKDPSLWQGSLQERWRDSRCRDIALGMTSLGPHRDELLLLLDGQEVRHYGSEGEKRSCAAVLRLAEWEEMKRSCPGDSPLFLIDDLGVGLDSRRQANLLNALDDTGQLFITSALPIELNRNFCRIALH